MTKDVLSYTLCDLQVKSTALLLLYITIDDDNEYDNNKINNKILCFKLNKLLIIVLQLPKCVQYKVLFQTNVHIE